MTGNVVSDTDREMNADLAVMRRFTDIFNLIGSDASGGLTELNAHLAAGNIPIFTGAAAQWVYPSGAVAQFDNQTGNFILKAEGVALSRPVEQSTMLAMLLERAEDVLARYTGEHPKHKMAGTDAVSAGGNVKRLAQGLRAIELATTARRDWLIRTTQKMFLHAATNPHFEVALMAKTKAAAAVRVQLALIGVEVGNERPPRSAFYIPPGTLLALHN